MLCFVENPEAEQRMGEYHRKGFGLKDTVKPMLEAAYASRVVDLLRAKGHQITRNGLTVRLDDSLPNAAGIHLAANTKIWREAQDQIGNRGTVVRVGAPRRGSGWAAGRRGGSRPRPPARRRPRPPPPGHRPPPDGRRRASGY